VPIGAFEPNPRSSARTWSLRTSSGRVFVKEIPDVLVEDHIIGPAMAFERQVAAGGVEMPVPVVPVQPEPGLALATRVEPLGLIRAYRWVEGRPLCMSDEVGKWLGTTLARIHSLRPVGPVRPPWPGVFPVGAWQEWLSQGQRAGLVWAPVLDRRLVDVESATAWIVTAYGRADDYVFAHRDVEPWNVLMTRTGPVLLDWDAAGEDSAGLVAGHAAFAFASLQRSRPDRGLIGRVLAAYADHGGGRLPLPSDLFARRVAIMLVRLAERIEITLGQQESGAFDSGELSRVAAERLEALPAFVAALQTGR
jgi:Ser/Thr protein kinase RdoA (MazF antagonist)